MRTLRLRPVCAVTALFLLTNAPATTPLGAQVRQPAATSRPGWLARDVVRLGGPLTAAQRATAIATLEEIQRILQQVPELANPQGFEIMPRILGACNVSARVASLKVATSWSTSSSSRFSAARRRPAASTPRASP